MNSEASKPTSRLRAVMWWQDTRNGAPLSWWEAAQNYASSGWRTNIGEAGWTLIADNTRLGVRAT